MTYRKIHVYAKGSYLGTVHNETEANLQREIGPWYSRYPIAEPSGVLTINLFAVKSAKQAKHDNH